MGLVGFLVLMFLTLSATTENPFPWAWIPALDAAIVVFNASIFVWKEISFITFIIFEILLEESFIMQIVQLTICFLYVSINTS